MTAHEPPHLARALLDLGDQLQAERERRERAEAERDEWRAAAVEMFRVLKAKAPAQAFGLSLTLPEAVVSVLADADEAELAALRRAGEGA